MCQISVKKATEAIVEMIIKKQEENEKKLKESFDILNKHLATIIAKSQSSHQIASEPHSSPQESQSLAEPSSEHESVYQSSSQPCLQPASQSKFQCAICGKTFGSSRTLTNHTRKDHELKPIISAAMF